MSTQTTVKINGRAYQVTCEEGKEEHVGKLAAFIDAKVKELTQQLGPVGDTRLLVLASLLIADELADAYDELHELRGERELPAPGATREAQARANEAEARAIEAESRAAAAEAGIAELRAAEERLAAGVERVAQRVEAIAESIARD
jgi:cell division protein ZapA